MASTGYRTALVAWIVGTLAYAAGFVATYALEGGRPSDDATLVTGEALGEDGAYTIGELRELGSEGALAGAAEFTGWLHHRAHFAVLEGTVRFEEGSGLPVEVALDPGTPTYFVPALLLLAAGYWLSARYPARDAVTASARGTYVSLGYVLPAVATIFLLEWRFVTGSSTLVIRPDPATAIAMTGVIYPVVAGGIGGYLAHEIHAEDAIGEQFG